MIASSRLLSLTKIIYQFFYVMDPGYVDPEWHTIAELVKSHFEDSYSKLKQLQKSFL